MVYRTLNRLQGAVAITAARCTATTTASLSLSRSRASSLSFTCSSSSSSSLLPPQPHTAFHSTAARLLKLKNTTGYVGVPVLSNADDVLIGLYQETLALVEQYKSTPAAKHWNSYVQQMTEHRLRIVQQYKQQHKVEGVAQKEKYRFESIEAAIGGGQMEDFVRMAEDEIELLRELNTNPQHRCLWELTDETKDEVKRAYQLPGAGTRWTRVSPEMFLAMEDEDAWKEIDAELDAEGVPKVIPFKADKEKTAIFGSVYGPTPQLVVDEVESQGKLESSSQQKQQHA